MSEQSNTNKSGSFYPSTEIEIVRVIRVLEWTGTRAALAAQLRRSLPDGQQWIDKNGGRIGGPNGGDYGSRRSVDMRHGDVLMTTTTLQPWGGQVVTKVDLPPPELGKYPPEIEVD